MRSRGGPWVTTINGGQAGSVVRFHNQEGLDSVLDGFTLTNGSESGIYCDSSCAPLIQNNIIFQNMGERGGGIHCHFSSPTIIHNTISWNVAEKYGAGIWSYYASPLMEGNNICWNEAKLSCGGIYCYFGSPVIQDNVIFRNWAVPNYHSLGGGINCYHSSPPITNNLVLSNSAEIGAGLAFHSSQSVLTNNTICGNTALRESGGIRCIYNSSLTVVNTILWKNHAPLAPEIHVGFESAPSVLDISHSNVGGGSASIHVEPGCTVNEGPGMLDADPQFVDENRGDYHLAFGSPCMDSGDGSAASLPTKDYEGDPRVDFGTDDMGADEFSKHLYHTGKAMPGGFIQLKFVGAPRTAQVGVVIGFGLHDPPLPSWLGDWYIMEPSTLVLGLPAIPPNGVGLLPGTLPATPAGPYTVYLQAIIGYELSNLSTLVVE